MTKSEELYNAARQKEAEARETFNKAREARTEELEATPLPDRLSYAAYARCPCGAGMAYDKLVPQKCLHDGHWDCSAIILGTANPDVQHTAKLPFMFYEIKGEDQPSANGATTR